jgi:farnesyl-diphosphate farnesyltransferase
VSPRERRRLLTEQLKGVSRAFYLTLRVLPPDMRGPVGLAYLLARAADTIADTRLLLAGERVQHLLAFRAQVQGPASWKVLDEIGAAVTEAQTKSQERLLLASLPQLFALLEALPEPDRGLVRRVVTTLTQGMEFDLTTFPPETSSRVIALKDAQELDRYTYLVAGCVGEFWTEMAGVHIRSLSRWDIPRMAMLGVRFGKALQLTNILRDVPKDLRQGRCYLPEATLSPRGLTAGTLLDPEAFAAAKPVLAAHLRTALEHYSAAEEYLFAIPRRSVRLRLAVLWPIVIGMGTLAKLSCERRWPVSDQPVKVSRAWVYRAVALSFLLVWSDFLVKAWLRRLREQVKDLS